MNVVTGYLQDLAQLVRWRLSLGVAAAGLLGFVVQGNADATQGWQLVVAIWLLAAGASAANQVQERHLDRRMRRTRDRPVAADRFSPRLALAVATTCVTGAGILLSALGFPWPLGLGFLALLLYNGLYTWFKPRTIWALLPGALSGALPPLLGWSAAGGHPLEFAALAMALAFFLWQIPHAWLLMMTHRSDYQRARLPVLFGSLPGRVAARLCGLWVAALAAALLLPVAFGLLAIPWLMIVQLTVAALLLLLALAWRTLSGFGRQRVGQLRLALNLAMICGQLTLMVPALVMALG